MTSLGKLQDWIERKVPDPLSFAIGLTLLMAALALSFTPTKPGTLLLNWGDSLSALLAFTMQMALIITAAYSLAHTITVQQALIRLARIATTPTQAYVLVILTGAFFSLLSWPLGPITAGLLAREIARESHTRQLNIHYPLLVAGGFGGFVVWEMGYSSSIGLAVATSGNPTEEVIGRLIPIQETLLTTWNLFSILTTLSVIILVILLIHRRLRLSAPYIPNDLITPLTKKQDISVPSVEGRRSLSLLAGALVLAYVVSWFFEHGVSLELNIVNWTFIGLGLVLARSLPDYSEKFAHGAQIAAPTLLQYPLYAGIMGMAMQSGLAQQFTVFLAEIASNFSLPIVAFLSAGLINIFIPSGGAQWALQGPSFIEAAKLLEVDLGVITMSVAYGDQWTNLIQPFTAIPILAMTGLRLRHIYGYCLLLCAATAIPLILGLIIAN